MFDSSSYGRLTKRANDWAIAIESISKYKENRESFFEYSSADDLNIQLTVIKENMYSLLRIFLSNLEEAMTQVEYKRHSEFGHLLALKIEYNIDLILNALVVDGEYGAFRKMEEVSGDLSDFYEGVEQAREVLIDEGKMTGKGNQGQRARFWKNVVWPTDDLYNDTIDIRMKAWGDLAPYWMLIEYGNFGNSGAYPQFTQTNFFHNSVIEAKVVIEELTFAKKQYYEAVEGSEELRIEEEYNQKELNLIYSAQENFLKNPDLFSPGEILGTFKNLETQKEYEIYITSRKKIGTRLRR